jgi:hypothetical protein
MLSIQALPYLFKVEPQAKKANNTFIKLSPNTLLPVVLYLLEAQSQGKKPNNTF